MGCLSKIVPRASGVWQPPGARALRGLSGPRRNGLRHESGRDPAIQSQDRPSRSVGGLPERPDLARGLVAASRSEGVTLAGVPQRGGQLSRRPPRRTTALLLAARARSADRGRRGQAPHGVDPSPAPRLWTVLSQPAGRLRPSFACAFGQLRDPAACVTPASSSHLSSLASLRLCSWSAFTLHVSSVALSVGPLPLPVAFRF